MKTNYIISCLAAFCTAFSSVCARPVTALADDSSDSLVSVVAYFGQRDTMTYWINESTWKVKDSDTVKTSGVATKVMLTVTEASKKGYGMEYKFLDFQCDTLEDSVIGDFQKSLVNKLSKDIIGTSVRFKTDRFGHITKYENLKEIRAQAKKLFDSAYGELQKLPFMDSLKAVGVDPSALLKHSDLSDLVEGYTEELETMFCFHGKAFSVGEFESHNDGSKKAYPSDSHLTISLDPESGAYSIETEDVTEVPAGDLKPLIATFANAFSDDILPDDFSDEYDKQVTGNLTITNYVHWKYFADGWPSEVLWQTESMLTGQGKLKQTYISWDTRHAAQLEE